MNVICDIGGTHMRVTATHSLDHIDEPLVIETPQSYIEGRDLLIKTIQEKLHGEHPKEIVIGLAGTFNRDHSELHDAPNIQDWEKKPLLYDLKKVFSCDIHLENDAALVGLGEAVFGAGRNHEIVAYITVSTGIGGSCIAHGRIMPNAMGHEPGRQILVINDELKTISDVASGAGLEKIYGKDAREIKDPEIWKKATEYLTYSLVNSILHWSPDVLVLGGGIIMHNAITIPQIQGIMKDLQSKNDIMNVYPTLPLIMKAELDQSSGLYGGLAYIKNRHHS